MSPVRSLPPSATAAGGARDFGEPRNVSPLPDPQVRGEEGPTQDSAVTSPTWRGVSVANAEGGRTGPNLPVPQFPLCAAPCPPCLRGSEPSAVQAMELAC